MARIKIGEVVGIINIVLALFGGGGRAQRIATLLDSEIPNGLIYYKAARQKIDDLEALPDVETYDVRLTHQELLALHKAHDLIRRTGRELRQMIRRL